MRWEVEVELLAVGGMGGIPPPAFLPCFLLYLPSYLAMVVVAGSSLKTYLPHSLLLPVY